MPLRIFSPVMRESLLRTIDHPRTARTHREPRFRRVFIPVVIARFKHGFAVGSLTSIVPLVGGSRTYREER